MTHVSRGISLGIVRPTQGADECGASCLESRVRSRSLSIRFVEEPVVISDDFDFDDFEDSELGPDLSLGEDSEYLLDSCMLDVTKWQGVLPIDAWPTAPHGAYTA